MTFLCMIALRDKTVEHTFLPGKIFEIQKFCYHGNVMSRISIIWSFVHFLLIGKDKLRDS